MKRLLLILLLLPAFVVQTANAQGWQWANSAISSDGNAIARDASGNVYVTGRFYSTITFGTTTLTNAGGIDMFIVKYDSLGNVIWAKKAGGNGDEEGLSVTLDRFGNVYVAGWFDSPALSFGSNSIYYTGGFGGSSMFIVKYDSHGNVIWAKSTDGALARSICTDASGNVYVAGGLGGSLATQSLTIVVKYDPWGNVLWSRNTGASYSCGVYAGICDSSGNVYVTGSFGTPYIAFGTDTLTNSRGVSYDSVTDDIFLVKYDSSGNVVWARMAGSSEARSPNSPSSIATDIFGNIYIAGYNYSTSVTFGSITLVNNTPANSWDMFLVKYNSIGTPLWARGATGTSVSGPKSIATDDTGNVYVVGNCSIPVTFGSVTIHNDGNYTPDRLFILKYDSIGNLDWVRTSSRDSVSANSITSDASANIYITGIYDCSIISFGTTTLTNTTGISNMFVGKLNCTLEDNTQIHPRTQGSIIHVYPNPTNTYVTVASSKTIANIIITNLIGETVFTEKYNDAKIEVDVTNLPKGIYFIKINGTEVRKFIKE